MDRVVKRVLKQTETKTAQALVDSMMKDLPESLITSFIDVFTLRNQVRVAAWRAELTGYIGKIRAAQLGINRSELELKKEKLEYSSAKNLEEYIGKDRALELQLKGEKLIQTLDLTRIAKEFNIPADKVGDWLIEKLRLEIFEAAKDRDIDRQLRKDQEQLRIKLDGELRDAKDSLDLDAQTSQTKLNEQLAALDHIAKLRQKKHQYDTDESLSMPVRQQMADEVSRQIKQWQKKLG